MARIAFILLTHKDPEGIIAQAERLTATGDYVAIHFDARAKPAHYAMLREALDDNPNVTFAKKRIKCGWGAWSLVAATLEAVKAAEEEFPRATHFYMLSGDCMQIKSAEYAHRFLDAEDVDYIESFDFHSSGWIKTGMKEDRLIYRHWFNERTQPKRFYFTYEVQKRFNLAREVPSDLQMMIGSQWWCLRRRTIEWVLDFIKDRPDVMRFFRTTWIPDETFFQTIVRHLVPENEIRTRTLTFLMFTDYGMPANFYNDHYDLLLSQDYLFARKISPEATELKARLGALWQEEGKDFAISNEGRELHRFLTARGRIGRRFAPRFWEAEATLGRERTLILVICKKWHVAKRLLAELRKRSHVPALDYVFNEMGPLPDLGGIETSQEKRNRHRRALMRMLFDYHKADRMVLCVDPASLPVIKDFVSDRCQTRLLEIECHFSDDYLTGHAQRVGLAGENTPPHVLEKILPTIRADLAHESEQIRDAEFENYALLREGGDLEDNARALAHALDIPSDMAQELAELDYIFRD
ncbi:DUF5928 domain-containing protein [Thioclava pacifica]|uniref:Peptide O-xylosyltransferase n=1 Tax=Thioclava pacifica DSM 10166 TaxID=1353537 RepID=A0A074IZD9_9RHOB|nr:DUF5928 domain-containing protein [Thioclava pacifica]KEO50496.1 hypothetical protein TP2_14610 [Thioclava pacifica DSM 10166]